VALEYAFGAIVVTGSDAVGTVYTVDGLSFQPKALMFVSGTPNTAVDAGSATESAKRAVGFATSTTNRACVATRSNDNAGTSVCVAGYTEGAVAMTLLASVPGVSAAVDLNSITSDGFTLIVDDNGDSWTIFWQAWGGDDITNAEVVTAISEPAADGAVDYTLSGAFQPDVLFLAGCRATAADTYAQGDTGIYCGFATSTASAQQVCLVANADHGSNTMDTDGWGGDGKCGGLVADGGGDLNMTATLSAFNSDGFELTWDRTVTDRKSIALAIKGGSWRAGGLTIAGNSGSATASVSGLPFTPKGLTLISRMAVEQADLTTSTEDRFGVGMGTSTTSRQSWGVQDADGIGTSETRNRVEYDQVLCWPNTDGTLLTAHDISAMASDGFTLVVDTAGGVADEWIGYLTFGDTPVAGAVTGHGPLLAFYRNRLVYT
jgi:hypothetical protein